ncbi:MAG: DNA polymerase III subunit gamma/tau [Candidatus Omnitrophica bacterium]|nr:DNA polymerase III subunit gamma/tau [Candidatus Omnitrophota bacterium]
MAYQVIARKYRPQRFADVVGQEHVTQTLANAIKQNRIAHAYLFVGPRGTGKTTIARIFAKCLNCTDGPKTDFPDDDPRCREISEGRSLDVLEIDGASNRGIEEIRALRETVKYAPAASRFKIYIIDEVHMLTKEAFNALLKTLEEPPAHVKFMFATTEPEKVLPTILSRCLRFDLRRIPVSLIVNHLDKIAKLEQVDIDAAALHAIARGAEGCMRDAESALDQLISFCGSKIVETDVLSMFGLTSRGQVHELAGAVLAGDMNAALHRLNELAGNGKDLSRLLSDLLNHFRNLLLFQITQGDLDVLEATEVEADVLKKQSRTIDSDALTQIMEVLADSESRLRDAASKKTMVELALIKAIQARAAVSLDAVLQQLRQLRRSSAAGSSAQPIGATAGLVSETAGKASGVEPVTSAPSTPPVAEPRRRRTSSTPAVADKAEVAPALESSAATRETHHAIRDNPNADATGDLESLWKNVLEAVGRASMFTRSYLLQARPVSFSNHVLTIGFDPEFVDQLELVDSPNSRTLIQTKLRELCGADIQVKFVRAESAGKPPTSAVPSFRESNDAAPQESPSSRNTPTATETKPTATKAPAVPLGKEDFKNDPLIKQALEIFRGQIVEVRA